MPYIDYEYYLARTNDADTPREDIERLLDPASEIVNEIALYQIGNVLEGFSAFQVKAIKDATVEQAYYLNQNGGIDVAESGVIGYTGHVQIGSFGYGNSQEVAAVQSVVSDSRMSARAYKLLEMAGLTYAGVNGCRVNSMHTLTPKPPIKPESDPEGGDAVGEAQANFSQSPSP